MRHLVVLALSALAATLLIPAATPAPAKQQTREYVVLYESGASLASARAAVKAAGGTIVKENRAIGVATVRSQNAEFAVDAAATRALYGAARNRPIGSSRPMDHRKFEDERLQEAREASKGTSAAGADTNAAQAEEENANFEPLAYLQWDMAQIRATKYESHDRQPGDKGVRVGIIDTGIDGSHPDLAANFDAALSRNFTTDIELVDGACADEPDQSCSDPANVDENGHRTHVAGTVAAGSTGSGLRASLPT